MKRKTNQFLFLYPIKEYFDAEIGRDKNLMNMPRQKFKVFYKCLLNDCISQRYRERGFSIGSVTFEDKPLEIVDVKRGDLILRNGITYVDHVNSRLYPDPNVILNQLPDSMKHLRLAGFHAWDCVEKVAKSAHERGIDILVDEDLTQFLISRYVQDPNFKRDSYPGFNPHVLKSQGIFESFISARKSKPWLWQKY